MFADVRHVVLYLMKRVYGNIFHFDVLDSDIADARRAGFAGWPICGEAGGHRYGNQASDVQFRVDAGE